MNNKLTLSDLASLLAERSGRSKNDTEKFLREFLNVVSEGLLTDKSVKLKGIGTFKIIRVERRESIDVNTGERFVIPEHYKYSYLPDKELKELVNKPFSLFETTEIINEVSFTDVEEVIENEDLIPEDESVEEDALNIPTNKENGFVVHSETEKNALPVIDKIIQPQEDRKECSPVSRETDMEEIPVVSVDSENKKESTDLLSDKEKTRSFYIKEVFYSTFILLGFAIIAYIIYLSYSQTPVLLTSEPKSQMQSIEVAVLAEPNKDYSTLDTLVTGNEAADDTLKDKSFQPMKEVEEKKVVSADTVIDRIKIEPGSRLTLISLKYYGDKLFWVYIYEANKEVIKNPNNIPIGTLINIPVPELYGIDAEDETSLSKAAALQSEILLANP